MQRFARFVALPQDPNGCWGWLGYLHPDGYAGFKVNGKTTLAYRFSHLRFVGEKPPELQLDHLCRNRWCVNPAHLEAVTARENTMRGNTPSSINARKTHCPRGHKYDRTFQWKDGPRRRCSTCDGSRKDTRRGRPERRKRRGWDMGQERKSA